MVGLNGAALLGKFLRASQPSNSEHPFPVHKQHTTVALHMHRASASEAEERAAVEYLSLYIAAVAT